MYWIYWPSRNNNISYRRLVRQLWDENTIWTGKIISSCLSSNCTSVSFQFDSSPRSLIAHSYLELTESAALRDPHAVCTKSKTRKWGTQIARSVHGTNRQKVDKIRHKEYRWEPESALWISSKPLLPSRSSSGSQPSPALLWLCGQCSRTNAPTVPAARETRASTGLAELTCGARWL